MDRTKPAKHMRAGGFTLIEMMTVIAIISLLAAIALPNYLAYRDKAFCSSVEYDAGSILASLSCYFSEPTNRTCNDLNALGDDEHCGFSLNNPLAALAQNGTGARAWWQISITDNSQRCPRGIYYTTYMGTSAMPGWR